MSLPAASPVKKLPVWIARIEFLVAATAVVGLLICLLIGAFHFRQRRFYEHELLATKALRQARLDLARGFQQVQDGNAVESKYGRDQGVALLGQALRELGQSIQDNDNNSNTTFNQEVAAFLSILNERPSPGDSDPKRTVDLRLRFHRLDAVAARIDAESEQRLQALMRHQSSDFAIFLFGVAAALMCFLGLVALVGRAARRAEESERQTSEILRAVAAGTTDAVFVKDIAGKYLLLNDAAARFFGKSSDDVIGRTDNDLFTEESARRIQERDRDVIRTGLPSTAEEELVTTDAARVFLSAKAPYRDQRGEIIGLIGISRDITERKRADQALTAIQAKLDDAQRFARLGSWSWEPATDSVWWSDTLYEIFGVDRQQVRPSFKAFLERLHPDDHPVAIARVNAVMNGENHFANDFRVIHPDGRRIWIHSAGRASRDAQGRILRMEGFDQDITARKEAEAKLLANEEILRHALNSAPGGAWEANLESGVAWWSPEMYDLCGVPVGTTIRLETAMAIVCEEDRERVGQAIQKSIDESTEYHCEFRIKHPQRGERWMLSQGKGITATVDKPHRVAGIMLDITDRKVAEIERMKSDEFARKVLSSSQNGLYVYDFERGVDVFVSGAYTEIVGLDQVTLDKQSSEDFQKHFHPEDWPRYQAHLEKLKSSGDHDVLDISYRFRRPDGKWVWCYSRDMVFARNQDGQVTRIIGTFLDITDLKRLEEQLRQSQKMEAVGRLAGGIAHDFNNLLTVINGYSTLLLRGLPASHPHSASAKAIHDAGEKAAALTRQLLAFSRKTATTRKTIDANEIVAHATSFLHRIIGEDIHLAVNLSQAPCWIDADPIQVDQVLLNLVINARDAMAGGGKLSIETGAIEFPTKHHTTTGTLSPGDYVELRVIDTGHGMSADVVERIFDPFFTTKEVGKGTGLGLAVVHGIVQEAGGQITVVSHIDGGTEFRVYFPASSCPTHKSIAPIATETGNGAEVILLVEDEEAVRNLCQTTLESRGYRVISAESGKSALQKVNRLEKTIDLIVTDVVMPEMNGHELAKVVRFDHPTLPILFMSGNCEQPGLAGNDGFLQKPFAPDLLLREVRAILDRVE